MFKFWKERNLQAWDLHVYTYDGIRDLQFNCLRLSDSIISVCLCVSPLAAVVLLVNSCVSKYFCVQRCPKCLCVLPIHLCTAILPYDLCFFLREQAARAAQFLMLMLAILSPSQWQKHLQAVLFPLKLNFWLKRWPPS